MENRFETVSSSAKNVKTMVIVWLVMIAVSLFGLLVSPITAIFLVVVCSIVCAVMIFTVARVRWQLVFNGKVLTLINLANRQAYCLDDLKHSDFVFTQSPTQEERNCAHLKIVGSSAVLHDVQRCAELKAYIDQNFG